MELRVEGGRLVITSGNAARSGWEEAFKAIAEQGNDAELLPDDLEQDFDETDWQW